MEETAIVSGDLRYDVCSDAHGRLALPVPGLQVMLGIIGLAIWVHIALSRLINR